MSGDGGARTAASERDRLAHEALVISDWPRDPVWGDIEVTKLELQIIDTVDFQRLRRVKQLGPTDWVYPGAKHDRFTHSLGTLYWAQRIVETCNKNAPTYDGETVTEYAQLLARLAALLHDLAHIPFGHTLEDEGSLWPSQWNDSSRVTALLGSGRPIHDAIVRGFLALGRESAESVVKDVVDIIVAKEKAKREDREEPVPGSEEVEIRDLPFPFVADIVGNTICADLLDYVARDFMHTGIREQYGDRFLRYFVVKRERPGAPPRLAIAVSGKDHRPRTSVVSEAVDLLRRRLSLAEKVYYHRTKIAASAMIISAVANSRFYRADYLAPLDPPNLVKDGAVELLKFGDDELVGLLSGEIEVRGTGPSAPANGEPQPVARTPVGNARCKRIIEHWNSRRLYKPVYRTSYWPGRLVNREQVDNLIDTYSDADQRLRAERRVEIAFGLIEGDVIVYCPPRKMGMKVYKARILLKGGRIVSLEGSLEEDEGYPDESVQDELKSIKDRHLSLWGLHTYLAPEAYERVDKTDTSDFCAELFGFPNDLDQMVVPGARSLRIVVRSHARKYSSMHPDTPINEPELTTLEATISGKYQQFEKATGLTYERFLEDLAIIRAARSGKIV